MFYYMSLWEKIIFVLFLIINQFTISFFGGDRSLNPEPCIYYILSILTELSLQERTTINSQY